MATPSKAFHFPLIDRSGNPTVQSGILGSVGVSEKYRGELKDSDELVVTIRSAIDAKKLSDRQSCLLRSFTAAWLLGKSKKVGLVPSYAIELPASVSFMAQVGFLDRTASTAASGIVLAAGMIFFLEATWNLAAADAATIGGSELKSMLAAEVGLLLLPDRIFHKIDQSFGLPGEALARSKFSPEPTYSFLQLCKLRSVLDRCDCEAKLRVGFENLMDRKTFALFLANSRQIEGLTLSGASEASAAVAAHTAIALGLSTEPNPESILERIENMIGGLKCTIRTKEATNTLSMLRQNLALDFSTIERQLNRQLASASTTEAVGLLAAPVELSFRLMGKVAETMESFAPPGHYKKVINAVSNGFRIAQHSADKTADVLATTIDSGISAEAWARKLTQNIWPFANHGNKEKADDKEKANDQCSNNHKT